MSGQIKIPGEVTGAVAVLGTVDAAGTESPGTVRTAEREIQRDPIHPAAVAFGEIIGEKFDLFHLHYSFAVII